MANVITLDSIREAVSKKYVALEIDLGGEVVTLPPLLALPADRRKKFMELADVKEEDVSVSDIDRTKELVLVLADKPKALEKVFGDDLTFYSEVLTTWQESTQLGEA